ncbi:MAG: M28 family peptidase [Elusimicrobia bacterium]|nr:M28 family peptidase [Elusimicrobiota bacterium]MBK7207504.1 M28 family peptidase [Elusimicrobiota bacterium]MBK7544274.1 M28 family peptidase [Elusimicrobiota bacterium]MBK7573796.1 M28 family peptidase [Elusimicrobiota bacterium]MBK7689394.1 M28 family peptidase [Elusimicrobiota bacterium]
MNPMEERLRTRVRALCDDFYPRDAGHPEVLARAADHLGAEFRTLGLSSRRQEWTAGESRYANVIADVGPASEDRIVIGAHYDTAGAQPGADDNASGVAGLFELAALLAARPPARRVELVAYCLEEAPHCRTPQMGSAVHAASLRAERARVRLMVSLEMIGYFRDARGTQRYPLPGMGFVYPRRGHFIAVVGIFGQSRGQRAIVKAMRGATPLPVRSLVATRQVPGIERSDHMNYWNEGYDAVMVTDTAEFRNPNYHTAADLPETLDYHRMAQVVLGVEAAVRRLADNP